MRYFLSLLILSFSTTATVWAQSETDLERFFQGQTITLRIDLSRTKDGVNIYRTRSAFDYKEVRKRINRHGAFGSRLRMVTISALNVSGKQIEVLVAGYGTPRNVGPFNIHVQPHRVVDVDTASVIARSKLTLNFSLTQLHRHDTRRCSPARVVKFGRANLSERRIENAGGVGRLLGNPLRSPRVQRQARW